jgi:hypothetical protein
MMSTVATVKLAASGTGGHHAVAVNPAASAAAIRLSFSLSRVRAESVI